MTKVLVRLFPSTTDSCIKVNSSTQLKIYSETNSEVLNFDAVGDKFYSQENIFQEIGTSVASSFKNNKQALILALGQKGSGKSYSLFGNGGQVKGLIDMIGYDLRVKGFELSISCYQIFNQQILDLMSPVPRARQLRQQNNKSTILQLTQIKLLQNHNIQSLLESARRNRKSVKINSQNQLTHSIVVVSMTARKSKLNVERKVNFVELADYESVFNDGRKLEVTGMNSKSMNQFIKMVHDRDMEFDYNMSKLTQILKCYINDNCNKYVLAHVKPEKKSLNQTLFTLEIANKIKNLKQVKEKQLNSVSSSSNSSCQDRSQYKNISNTRRTTIVKNPETTNPMSSLIHNEKHFKNLIQLYEKRIYQMEKTEASQVEIEKKILQKVAHEYAAIVKNFPTFSEILVENMNLKQQQLQVSQKTICSPFAKKQKQKLTSFSIPLSSLEIIPSNNNTDLHEIVKKQNEMLEQYQEIFSSFKQSFIHRVNDISRHYLELEKKFQTQTKLHFATASIKDFIIQDDQVQTLKSEITILKLQNKSLKKKNSQLLEDKFRKQMSLFDLQSLKARLLDIKNSIVKDQQNQKSYKQQIDSLKRQLEEYKGMQQLQQSITIKKSKGVDKSYDRVNQTTQTLLFQQSHSQIANHSSITNKQKMSLSELLINKIQNKQNLRDHKIKIFQKQQIIYKPEKCLNKLNQKMMLDKKEKKSKIQKSELERLRLILLKSKEKTNKTKLRLLDDSFKCNIVQSKSSIISRNQSNLSGGCSSRLWMAAKQNRYSYKYRPYVSDRQSPQNKSME